MRSGRERSRRSLSATVAGGEFAERRAVEPLGPQAEEGEHGRRDVDETAGQRALPRCDAASVQQQERPGLVGSAAAMLSAADRRGLARLGDGPTLADDAKGVGVLASRHVDGRHHAAAGGVPACGECAIGDDLAGPSLVAHEREHIAQRRMARRCRVEQGGRSLAGDGDIAGLDQRTEALRRQPGFEVDAIADGLLPVIRSDHQQDVVAACAQALDGLQDLAHVVVGLA